MQPSHYEERSLPPSLENALTAHDGIYRRVTEALTDTHIHVDVDYMSATGRREDVGKAWRYLQLLKGYMENGAASLKDSDNTGGMDLLPVPRDDIPLVMGGPNVQAMRECGCLVIPGRFKGSDQHGIFIFGQSRRACMAARMLLMRLVESTDHPAAARFFSGQWTDSRHSRRDELVIDRIALSGDDLPSESTLHVFRRMDEGRMAGLTRRVARASGACGVERVGNFVVIGGMREERRAAIAYLRLQALWEQGKDGELWFDLPEREDVLVVKGYTGGRPPDRLADTTHTLIYYDERSRRVAIVSVHREAREAACHALVSPPTAPTVALTHMGGGQGARHGVSQRRRHEEDDLRPVDLDSPRPPADPIIAALSAELAQVAGEIRNQEGLIEAQQQEVQRITTNGQKAQEIFTAAQPDIHRLQPLMQPYQFAPYSNLTELAVASATSRDALIALQTEVVSAIEVAHASERRSRRVRRTTWDHARQLEILREEVKDTLREEVARRCGGGTGGVLMGRHGGTGRIRGGASRNRTVDGWDILGR
ncbi:unnamed protein product [Vitrella brassicaformis CCMP3155]|uniref:Uncharacterized protein n=1 Tax=Vitrella brassicaformis (strain CCMP3155) TaxID=1169540 RepID=A0A0G4GIU5_VITBC|nr:unnamed protein product [Vitrella brassicaformis CCMP3155]|eukprot:CEM29631.1 unnamed protein product [Vitrella brassicaformis CCMP3155]